MLESFLGGSLIGLAAALLLIVNGRIAGVSGILGNAFAFKGFDRGWRFAFVLGLLLSGAVFYYISPWRFELHSVANLFDYALAGILVGFGSRLGSGCTSGHGVCGLSRLSKRSFVATGIFMLCAGISLAIFKLLKGAL